MYMGGESNLAALLWYLSGQSVRRTDSANVRTYFVLASVFMFLRRSFFVFIA